MLVAFDVETTGLKWARDRLHGFALAWGPDPEHTAYFLHGQAPRWALDLLADPTIAKCGHNLRFDLRFARANGIAVDGPRWCTQLAAMLVDENRELGLKALARGWGGPGVLGRKNELDATLKAMRLQHVGQLCELDLDYGGGIHPFLELIAEYAREDAANTWTLFHVETESLKEKNERVKLVFGCERGPLDYYIGEAMPAERAMLEVELPGVRITRGPIESYGQELRGIIDAGEEKLRGLVPEFVAAIEQRIYDKVIAGLKDPKAIARRVKGEGDLRFNWESPKHLPTLLYEFLGAPMERTRKGNPTTAEKALLTIKAKAEPHIQELIGTLLERRGYQKLLSTYVEGILERTHGERVYGEYPQYTDTGRFSSEDPNMQNIPRDAHLLKRGFIPDSDEHVFIYGDYSQVELRIAAHLSQDPTMLAWFRDGIDPHCMLASTIFGEAITKSTEDESRRQVGKEGNFLFIFDGSAFRFQQALLDKTKREYSIEFCKKVRNDFFNVLPRYKEYLRDQLALMRHYKALVAESGRVRRLPDIEYGAYLDWRGRRFTGPWHLREPLKAASEEEAFQKARRRFEHAKKQGYNFPIQSLGATITKAAIRELVRLGYRVVTTVHDSLIIQVRKAHVVRELPRIRAIMENAYKLTVPLKVDTKMLNSFSDKDVFFVPSQFST